MRRYDAPLDPRIGKLNSGLHYAFVSGYDVPAFEGTRAQVEAALGLRVAPATTQSHHVARELCTFDVKLTFEYPAWDEVDGIWYRGIHARSKFHANSQARRFASNDGHTGCGKGRATFTAFETDDTADSDARGTGAAGLGRTARWRIG